MTLTGLPRAGADPELRHYKETYKKMKVLPKTLVSPNNRLIVSAKNSNFSRLAIDNKTEEPHNLKGKN